MENTKQKQILKSTLQNIVTPYKQLNAKNSFLANYPNLTKSFKNSVLWTKFIPVDDKLTSSNLRDVYKVSEWLAKGRWIPAWTIDAMMDQGRNMYYLEKIPKKVILHEQLHNKFNDLDAIDSEQPEGNNGLMEPVYPERIWLAHRFDNDYDQTVSDLEKTSNRYSDTMKWINKHLNDKYTEPSTSTQMPGWFDRATERYAYLGMEGKENIPPKLKKYYKWVFK